MLRAVYSFVILFIIFDLVIAVDYLQNQNRSVEILSKQPKYDTSAQRQAAKIIHMFREVILDMQRKLEAHYIIVHKWRNHRRFQIGEIVYDIRKRASLLKSILRQNLVWDNLKKEFLMANRTENPKKDYLSIKDMARCQYESMEIDQLVHMVEKYHWATLNSSNIDQKFKYSLRTDNKSEKENKKSILREQMKNINNNQEDGLSKLVEKLEDIPGDNLKELLKKIGDGPQKRTKNIEDMRQEGFKHIKKMVETNKKISNDPKHPGDGFETDDDEAWK